MASTGGRGGVILVSNFGDTTTSASLTRLFREYGNVLDCKVVVPGTDERDGYALLRLDSTAAATRALAVSGCLVDSRVITVESLPSEYSMGSTAAPSSSLYVKGLATTMTSESLSTLFEIFGPVDRAEVAYRINKRKKKFVPAGWGIVRFVQPEDAVVAMNALQYREINHQLLHIKFDESNGTALDTITIQAQANLVASTASGGMAPSGTPTSTASSSSFVSDFSSFSTGSAPYVAAETSSLRRLPPTPPPNVHRGPQQQHARPATPVARSSLNLQGLQPQLQPQSASSNQSCLPSTSMSSLVNAYMQQPAAQAGIHHNLLAGYSGPGMGGLDVDVNAVARQLLSLGMYGGLSSGSAAVPPYLPWADALAGLQVQPGTLECAASLAALAAANAEADAAAAVAAAAACAQQEAVGTPLPRRTHTPVGHGLRTSRTPPPPPPPRPVTPATPHVMQVARTPGTPPALRAGMAPCSAPVAQSCVRGAMPTTRAPTAPALARGSTEPDGAAPARHAPVAAALPPRQLYSQQAQSTGARAPPANLGLPASVAPLVQCQALVGHSAGEEERKAHAVVQVSSSDSGESPRLCASPVPRSPAASPTATDVQCGGAGGRRGSKGDLRVEVTVDGRSWFQFVVHLLVMVLCWLGLKQPLVRSTVLSVLDMCIMALSMSEQAVALAVASLRVVRGEIKAA